MKPHGSGTRIVLEAGLLAAGLLLALGPATVWAQGCVLPTPSGPVPVNGTVSVILQEETELANFQHGVIRHARATEHGRLTNACGTLADLDNGKMMVRASSWVPVTNPETADLGHGPIAGSFRIVSRDEADNSMLSRVGVLSGTLDFSPTNAGNPVCGGPCPWVIAQGTWQLMTSEGLSGQFSGLALVPFPCPTQYAYCYIDPTGTLAPLTTPLTLIPAARSDVNGGPEAKFIVTLYQ
jgi:hypothetical protein